MALPTTVRERKRLAALKDYDILDTVPEKAFDDLVYLASYISQTPIALVSLVDENRQWFKAKVGLDVEQISRNVAFCSHAIKQPKKLFVVKDACEDARFKDNPLVTSDPKVRFYAGAPLVTSDGDALGALCVIDRVPRELSPEQYEALRALSTQVMAQLELRRIARKLIQARNDGFYLEEEILAEHHFGEIIGTSKSLKAVLRKTKQVAATDTTVLIVGETGTGKELIARALHNDSPRRTRPMIKVNCAALPANLIESELFGHERGAFTGANAARIGRFEMADGATIFLDEIGELPLELQAKLLRVLQDGEFERVGSSRTTKVDVRVIAATNRDLEAACREGTFRSDLYYRLHVFPIALPTLSERRDDIPALVSTFVQRENKRLGKNIQIVPREVMDRLQNYSWPGNIRELQAVIERAAIVTDGSELQLAEKPGSAKTDKAGGRIDAAPLSIESGDFVTLEEYERRYILRVLEKTKWRIHGKDGSAEILGMNSNTLRSRLQKLGISRPVA